MTDVFPRCFFCGRVLAAFVTRPWTLKCKRCGTESHMPDNNEPRPEPISDEHQTVVVPVAPERI